METLRIIAATAAVLLTCTAFSMLYSTTARGTGKGWKIPAHAFNISGCIAFVMHFMTDGMLSPSMHKILSWYGYLWMFIVCNGIFILIPIAAVRMLMQKTGCRMQMAGKTSVGIFLAAIAAVCTAGYINYISIRTYRISFTIDGNKTEMTDCGYASAEECIEESCNDGEGKQTVRIVFASDIHLGESIGADRLEEFMDHIRSLEPDIVIFGGDLLDRGAEIPISYRCHETISGLDVPFGKYAVFGNHEYYAEDFSRILSFYDESGIEVLRDSSVTVCGRILVSGKDDSSHPGHSHVFPEGELTEGMAGMFRLGISHRPENIEKFADNGYDLVLCGHTHNGQFFPGNILVRFDRKHNSDGYIYGLYGIRSGKPEKDRKGCKGGKAYVSCGLGLWGPHFRTFSRSETVLVTLTFMN